MKLGISILFSVCCVANFALAQESQVVAKPEDRPADLTKEPKESKGLKENKDPGEVKDRKEIKAPKARPDKDAAPHAKADEAAKVDEMKSEDAKTPEAKAELIKRKMSSVSRLQNEIESLQHSLSPTTLDHEFFGSLSYITNKGSVKSAAESEPTKISQAVMSIKAGYGYIIDDHLEPFFELDRQSITKTVEAYNSTKTTTVATLGLLVNLPIASDALAGHKFYHAEWIPYIGFMFTKSDGNNESGTDSKSTVIGNGLSSRLTVGLRYKIFERVALGSYIRLTYATNSETATLPNELGSTSTGLGAEVQLLGISIFI